MQKKDSRIFPMFGEDIMIELEANNAVRSPTKAYEWDISINSKRFTDLFLSSLPPCPLFLVYSCEDTAEHTNKQSLLVNWICFWFSCISNITDDHVRTANLEKLLVVPNMIYVMISPLLLSAIPSHALLSLCVPEVI